MIKRITAEEVLELLQRGKEVYYFDLESKEIAPLSKVLETVPGVFLTEDTGEPVEFTLSTTVPTQQETPVKPEEKKKSVPKNIDKGKVKALYRAGWSMTKIADEMDVSVAAISYHLTNMGLK